MIKRYPAFIPLRQAFWADSLLWEIPNRHAMKTIDAGDLNIAYHDYDPADGPPVILLHGFPYDARAYDEIAATLATKGLRCIVPYLRGYGPTTFRDAATMRSGQQAAIGHDLKNLMEALAIPNAILGGYDWGGRAACIVAALWPAKVQGLVSCGQGYNIQNIASAMQPASAEDEARYWYQYLFNMPRGEAALTEDRNDICGHIWKLWSPSWAYGQATFDASATSFENPDFVEVVIHSYRHRYGVVPGDPRYDATEALLAAQPKITVPAVVMQGRDDGVDPPSEADHDKPHFTDQYRRVVLDGVGHNFPQEAPDAFADAVLSLA